MKQAIVFFGLLAVASAAWKGGLRARFEYGLGYGKDAFCDTPRTVEDAKKAGYTKRERPAGEHLPSLEMYCPSPNAALCCLFDDTGYIAGLQVGLESKMFNNHFDLEKMGMKPWTTTDGEYWTIGQYFVSQEFLDLPQEYRTARRNPDTTLQQDSVWVTGPGGELVEVPRDQDKLGNTLFTKQACMPWMGRHYYYNMSSTTECTAESMFPWFPMYDDGELIGMGFVNFGPLAVPKGAKIWFETPDRTAVKIIVPRGPECLYELAANPGILTMHTYFIDQPWKITCLHMPKLPLPSLSSLPSLPKIPHIPFLG